MATTGVSHPARSAVFAAYVGNIRIDMEYTNRRKSMVTWRTEIFSLEDNN